MSPDAPLCIGSTHDDLRAIAAKVYQDVNNGVRCVWLAADGRIFSASPIGARDVPEADIAGTYSMGMPLGAIEDDLRTLLRERATHSIISPDDASETEPAGDQEV